MNGTPFKLATLRKPNGSAFVAIVLGEDAVDLKTAHAAYGKGPLSTAETMIGLLEDWDANFAVLQEVVAFIEKNGLPAGSAKLANVHALPPVLKPGKMCQRDAECGHDAGRRAAIYWREIVIKALSVPQSLEHAGRRI